MDDRALSELKAEHTPSAVAARIEAGPRPQYVRDFIYGSVDGCVTTFAIVSGVVGAELPAAIVLILGAANLLADGFSMAVSNFLGTRAERRTVRQAWAVEESHIARVPEGEREEIREIFRRKGFDGELLEQIVEVITANRRLWVETMLREELGLALEGPSPGRAALVTFGAFVLVGAVPLLPFAFVRWIGGEWLDPFLASCAMTAVAFFVVGAFKSAAEPGRWLRSGLETLAMGGGAASVAYAVGAALKGLA
jgi:VIT1/CCC1 family predicted Fe2+/Mn2+ transporter